MVGKFLVFSFWGHDPLDFSAIEKENVVSDVKSQTLGSFFNNGKQPRACGRP